MQCEVSNWTIGTSMHWTKIRVSKTWYKNDQKKLRRAIGFWELRVLRLE